jgi:holo-[acyl-carrier protein] synthase
MVLRGDAAASLERGALVIGLGVDLVEVERVARALERWGGRLVDRLMGETEATTLPLEPGARATALAQAIAGKEAASKAIGTGWSHGVRWRDVVVDRDAPSVRYLGRALVVAQALGSSGRTKAWLELRGGLAAGEVRLLS